MSGRRVLVVDDETDIRTVASIALGRVGGMDVTTAASGAEALALAVASPPDAIVLDVMMPGMDGPSTFEALRREPATAGVPVVFLTAKTQASDRERLVAQGAEGVLAKPFDPMTLANELAAVLGWA